MFVFSQANISFKILTYGFNPFNDLNKPLYNPNILDSSGFMTYEPGLQVSAEIFNNNTTSAKFITNYNKDQVGFHSGYSQFLIRFQIIDKKKYNFNIGIGPIMHYRKSWQLIPNYQAEKYFIESGISQYKMTWLSGEIEYNYRIHKRLNFSVSLNHIHPRSVGLYFGLKIWFKVKFSSCSTCHSYD